MQSRSSRAAASRSPALVIASRGEGLGVRPRATGEQLVGVGQGGCALPSRKGSVRCGARCAGPGGGRGRQRPNTQVARTTRDWRVLGAGHKRGGGAHLEHEFHARGAGRDEAQRLVESRRFLPSRKQGVRCRARCAGRKAGELGRGAEGRAQAARTRRTRDWRAEGRARGARPMSNSGGRGAAAGASSARGVPVALEGCVGARHARRSARRT